MNRKSNTIIRKFTDTQEKKPSWGNWTALIESVSGTNLTHLEAVKLFRRCVPKDDYQSSDFEKLVNTLIVRSK